jgi:transposase
MRYSEKLEYTPGVFTIERYVRGKWVRNHCRALTQAPVPAYFIDKGISTAGLLAHVLVSKHGDHLPLHRQDRIFVRAGLTLPQSTLGQWAGMCGVQLQPLVDVLKEKILNSITCCMPTRHRFRCSGRERGKAPRLTPDLLPGALEQIKAMVYDFVESRAGEHRHLHRRNRRHRRRRCSALRGRRRTRLPYRSPSD